MPIIQTLISFDDLYQRSKNDKYFINDIDPFNEENRKIIDSIMASRYTGDNISLIPSCDCGEIKGTYYVGQECPKCNTKVKASYEDNLSYLLWFRRSDDIAPFINPVALSILDNRFKVGKTSFRVIRWLMQPKYQITKEILKSSGNLSFELEEKLKAHNIERGYNSFVYNFDTIMKILFDVMKLKQTDELQTFINDNKRIMFSNYLPFPNKMILAYESNELGIFIDKSIINPINVIRRLSGFDVHKRSSYNRQDRVASSLIDLSQFYKDYMKKTIFEKEALVRQHVISSRMHFSARAVITSLTDVHDYDELHIPWSVGCSLFREHIISKLLKRGYVYKDAVNYLIEHNQNYSPLLDEIFHELINETGEGIPVFFNRNPSLHRGNIQRHRITKVKTNINDRTFSISLLVFRSYNADVDGDELNLTYCPSEIVIQNLNNFSPHHNVLDLNEPNGFSDAIALPKPIVSTIYRWLFKD